MYICTLQVYAYITYTIVQQSNIYNSIVVLIVYTLLTCDSIISIQIAMCTRLATTTL